MHNYSPLRYPGGKARIAEFIKGVFHMNRLDGGVYVEPYAGGASVAIALLLDGTIKRAHINDVDPNIWAIWHSVVHETDAFCERISNAKLTIEEWRAQRDLYRGDEGTTLDRGFAAFFLNRTNRSGIIGNGGVIGGLEQSGTWKMGARFPRDELIRRVRVIGQLRSCITLHNSDAVDLLDALVPVLGRKALLYLDPPYFEKGQGLYRNAYGPDDHAKIASKVDSLAVPWVVSYDNVPEVRALYKRFRCITYDLRYTARKRYDGREVMFFSKWLRIPKTDNPGQFRQVAEAKRPPSRGSTRLSVAVRARRKGATQREAAPEIGTHCTTLSRIERGAQSPSGNTAAALARWLGWSVEEVLVAANEPAPPDAG